MGKIILSLLVLILSFMVIVLLNRNKSGQFRQRRILFFVLAMAGVLLMIWKPVYSGKAAGINVHIGKGLDSLKGQFSSVHELLLSDKWSEIDTVFVNKRNISIEDLELIDKTIKANVDTVSSYFPYVEMPNMVTEYESVKLRVFGQAEDEKEFTLKIPDSREIQLQKNGESHYMCDFKAPVHGEYVYKLGWVNSNGDSITIPLPLIVQEKPQIEMLMLLSAPFFEMNYLKNYWVDQGHRFSQRIQISRNNYWTGFVNTDEKNLTRLSEELLSEYDVLIVDIVNWNNLSASNRSTILRKVENDGLGLMLMATEAEQVPGSLPYIKAGATQEIIINGVPQSQITVQKNAGWKTITKDHFVLGEQWALGAGKVFLPRLGGTYALILEGQKGIYQDIWASIFNSLYNNYENKWRIHLDQLPVAGKNTDLTIFNDQEEAAYYLNGDEKTVSTLDIPFLEETQEASVRPRAGWNTLSNGSEEVRFYGYPDTSVIRLSDRRMVENFIQSINFSGSDKMERVTRKPLPWWLGLIVFTVGMGLLWLDERVYGVGKW